MDRKCIKCDIVKKQEEFNKVGNICKKCHCEIYKARASKLKKELDPNKMKKCTVCKIEMSETNFAIGYKLCKKCLATKRKDERENIKLESSKENDTKKCKRCDTDKQLNMYPLGEHVCKECKYKASNEWRDDRPNISKAYSKKYRAKPGAREKRREYKKKVYLANPQNKIADNYRSRLRIFMIKGTGIKMTKVLGLDHDQFRNWIEFNFKDDMNWDNYGKRWNLDHITPCLEYDLTVQEELEKCFFWENISPIYCEKNSEKSCKVDSTIINYYKKRAKQFKKTIE